MIGDLSSFPKKLDKLYHGFKMIHHQMPILTTQNDTNKNR